MDIKKVLVVLCIFTSFILADELFIQTNYGVYDGKATSYQDTADDHTQFPSLLFGNKYKSMNIYLSYDYLKWDDAKAQNLLFNVDYLIPIKSLEYYIGLGIGAMKYEGDDIDDIDRKAIASFRSGVNYSFWNDYYLNIGGRYIYTNDIEIRDSSVQYSSIENLLGIEIGIGIKF